MKIEDRRIPSCCPYPTGLPKSNAKITIVLIAIGLISLSSCNNDDSYSLDKVWYSLATIHPEGDAHTYSLILDDGTTLWPAASDVRGYIPRLNQRALVLYTILSDAFQGYDHAIKIHDIYNILTKSIAPDLSLENDTEYGTDPVYINDIWIGDGYLNVNFSFSYGGYKTHFINLVKRDLPDAPYYFEFRHNAYGDVNGGLKDGLVSFDLSSLGVTEPVDLTINVRTFDGKDTRVLTFTPNIETALTSHNFSSDFTEIK